MAFKTTKDQNYERSKGCGDREFVTRAIGAKARFLVWEMEESSIDEEARSADVDVLMRKGKWI